jgi:hypothetical protein
MRRPRIARALAFAALVLAGCPIPQTVPEYPKGGSITPPRIVAETAVPSGTFLTVPSGCATSPTMPPFSAKIVDENVTEPVEARWFVDYDPASDARSSPLGLPVFVPTVDQPDPNSPKTERTVPPLTAFHPYDFGSAVGSVHVLELVVSNGFDPTADTLPSLGGVPALPYRTPLGGFETQVYRWVILLTNAPCP